MPGEIIVYKDLLKKNLEDIRRKSPSKNIWFVCKANSYGVGTFLLKEIAHEVFGFAVATFEEAKEILNQNLKKPILVMNGYTGKFVSKENSLFCEKNNIIPVLHKAEDLHSSLPEKFYLKFNTGMNRLGLSIDQKNLPKNPYGIMSHFATASSPGHEITQSQVQKYLWLCESIKAEHYSMSNSSAIISELLPQNETHVRPGISLYLGLNGENTIFDWVAPIIDIREIKTHETVAYNFTYRAKSPRRIAVLWAGYADGIPRSLSNRGHFWLNKSKVPIVGTVCMDLTMIDVTDVDAKIGDGVHLVKAEESIRHITDFSETFNYEFLTGLSRRNDRKIEARQTHSSSKQNRF